MSARNKIAAFLPSKELGEAVAEEILYDHRTELAAKLRNHRFPAHETDGVSAAIDFILTEVFDA